MTPQVRYLLSTLWSRRGVLVTISTVNSDLILHLYFLGLETRFFLETHLPCFFRFSL